MSLQVLASKGGRRTFHVYNVRCPVKPKACRLDIYDPDFNIVHTEPIVEDDFVPTDQASTFQVDKVIPFQPQKAGDYHFVVEAQQSLDPRELNDAGKWALERNQSAKAPTYALIGGVSPARSAIRTKWGQTQDTSPIMPTVKDYLRDIGYSAGVPQGRPWWMPNFTGALRVEPGDTSKRIVGISADETYGKNAAGQLNPPDQGKAYDHARQQSIQYNAIWVYAGHGFGGRIMGVWDPSPVAAADGDRSNFTATDNERWSWIEANSGDVAQLPDPVNQDSARIALNQLPNALRATAPGPNTKWSWQNPLAHSRLVVFLGCETAVAGDGNDLPSVAAGLGAQAAIGFIGEIKVDDGQEFLDSLTWWMAGKNHGGGNATTLSLISAIGKACTYSGIKPWQVKAVTNSPNLTISPAAWGDSGGPQ